MKTNVLNMEDRRSKKNDDLLLEALASGMSITDAANHADLHRSTVYKRLEEPEFVALLEEEKRRFNERTHGALVCGTMKAIETLMALLDHDSTSVRLQAARSLLSNGVRVVNTSSTSALKHDEQVEGSEQVILEWSK